MISLGDALLKIGVDKTELERGLQEVENRAKQTQQTFRALERVTRPLGVALVGVGAAGLTAAEATKDWDNALSGVLQRLRPVFGALTAIGGVLMTLPPMIRGVKVAFDLLKVAAASTAGVLGVVGLSIGAVGLLVYGLTRLFPAMHADTERWTTALEDANKQLADLKDNGQGTSAEADNLRLAIDGLTSSLAYFSKVGDDNVVTTTNLADAVQKLADESRKLTTIAGAEADVMGKINQSSNWGKLLFDMWNIAVGDTASNVVELTTNIEALKDAQEEELETARNNAVKELEELYGFRADETKSLLELYNEEVEARQDSLDDQLNDVRDSTDDVIKQYRREYDAKVKFLNDETDAQIEALQERLDLLNETQESSDEAAEDAADAKTEAALRARLDKESSTYEWTREGRARAEDELADFLEDRARRLADRQRQDARESLQNQIRDVQRAAEQKQAEYQQELDDKTDAENAKLAAAEIVIQSELDALQTAANIKRGILQQEFNDAVAIQNAIRDNAIAAMNTVINAQLMAANISSVPVTAAGAIDMQSGIDYENWAAANMGGVRRYATGGSILEPTLLYGLRSGRRGIAGEAGPEYISPLGAEPFTISGNTFYIREEADIHKVAAELHRIRILKGNFGKG